MVVRSKTPSKIENAGAGLFGRMWEAAWNCRTCGHVDFITDNNAQNEDSRWVFLVSLDHCELFKGLNFGASSLLFRTLFLCL